MRKLICNVNAKGNDGLNFSLVDTCSRVVVCIVVVVANCTCCTIVFINACSVLNVSDTDMRCEGYRPVWIITCNKVKQADCKVQISSKIVSFVNSEDIFMLTSNQAASDISFDTKDVIKLPAKANVAIEIWFDFVNIARQSVHSCVCSNVKVTLEVFSVRFCFCFVSFLCKGT